ncbi:transport protein [Lactiplantibacillus fabifermentans DSM 21115]|uniref:Transport protein n=1 Tax=Lactiplantibacillus fabifermentans DSM 21115 TaxID=1413187 RepID=A0A0R2NDX2_9LACO|nr:transport protein [Lactiplantibacillus fabifermentans DSM 21115]
MLLDSWSLFIYTLGLPVFLMLVNDRKYLGQSLTWWQYTNLVLPFVAWVVIANTLEMLADVARMREQGYLKQYYSLVVSPSVLIVSKLLVNLMMLLLIISGVGLVSGWLFHLPVGALLVRLWLTLLLSYLPLVGLSLPILSWSVRYQSVNAIVNVVALVIMLGSAAVMTAFTISFNSFIWNLVSPAFLITDSFYAIGGHFSAFAGAYGGVLLVALVIGMISYRQLKILPTEGI